MDNKIIETVDHDYTPVNKYIDDQSRLKRSTSSWRYAKSTALILVAAGILAVLLAWAYHIFKKPHHDIIYSENEIIKSQEEEKDINNDIIDKNDEIQEKENELKNSPENEKLKDLNEVKNYLENKI